jgi:hypothetical protein
MTNKWISQLFLYVWIRKLAIENMHIIMFEFDKYLRLRVCCTSVSENFKFRHKNIPITTMRRSIKFDPSTNFSNLMRRPWTEAKKPSGHFAKVGSKLCRIRRSTLKTNHFRNLFRWRSTFFARLHYFCYPPIWPILFVRHTTVRVHTIQPVFNAV